MSQPKHSPLAACTIEYITDGVQSSGAPCLPELVEIIHSLTAKVTDISVNDLAELIKRHVTVMAKVIAAANTLGYNPTGVEISTVNQAIHVIGFDRIRSLVTSIVLLHHAEDPKGLEEQRATALLALCSGLSAQALAAERGLVDAELAFVVASLRSFGRLLMTAYMPDHFHEAQRLAQTMPEPEAFRQIFGLTALDLGHELLRSAHVPPVIVDVLCDCTPETLKTIDEKNLPLLLVTDFSTKLCELVMDRQLSPTDFTEKSRLLAARYEPHFRFTDEEIPAFLAVVGERVAQFTNMLGFGAFAGDLVALLEWRSTGGREGVRSTTEPAGAAPLGTTAEAAPANNAAAGAAPDRPPAAPPGMSPLEPLFHLPPMGERPVEIAYRCWRDGLESISDFMAQPRRDFHKVERLALEYVRRGFGAPEALWLSAEDDDRHFVVTLGRGQMFEALRGECIVRREEQTVFGICLERRETIVIHNTGDPKLATFLPPWCTAGRGLGAFVAIPVGQETPCFALMLLGWPEPRHINIRPEYAKLLRSLLALVSTARQQTGLA